MLTKKKTKDRSEADMKIEPLSTETDGLVCDLLMRRIGTPKDLIMCRAINLWDNRYRINVYTKHDVDGIESKRISYSCFAKLDNKDLIVINESPQINI